MRLEIIPLHEHPKYIMDCCKILNDEWKRSDTARLHSLQSSCKELPTSLILLGDKILIGHLKLSNIPSMKNACYVESVVIDKHFRGKGYGSILMKEAEDYCRNILKIDRIYLSTRGQELFYQKLGYIECTPISIYGCNVPKLPTHQNYGNRNYSTIDGNMVPTLPPPPPPPPQPNLLPKKQIKTFLMKEL